MKRKSVLLANLLALILLGLVTAPTYAQSPWFAYLFSGSDKSLLRVDQTGQQTSISLGLAATEYTSPYNMSFSADGSKVGYCSIAFTSGEQLGTATAYARDIAGQTNLIAANLGKTMACQSTRQSLSPDGTLLAVSLTNYFIGDNQADSSRPAWQLVVLDTATGNIVHELNANSPNVPDAGGSDASLIADVRYFDGQHLVFGATPYGTEGPPTVPTYVWQFDTGTVTPLDSWNGNGIVYLQETGEMAWIASDPTLPAGNPGGPVPATNVVMMDDKFGAAKRVYHSPDWLVSGVQFVNSGRDLAILLTSSYDPNQSDQQMFFKWVLLDRTGAVTEIPVNNAVYSDIGDALDGYALLWEEYAGGDPSKPIYHLDLTSGGQTSEIWSTRGGDPTVNWQLAWTLPSPLASDLPPFPAM